MSTAPANLWLRAILLGALALAGAGEVSAKSLPQEGAGADRPVLRSRYLVVDPDQITERRTVGDHLSLRIFDDVSLTAELERSYPSDSGSLVWHGRLLGVDHGEATFVVDGRVVAGSIRLPGRSYELRYVGRGRHELRELDDRVSPSLAGDLVDPESLVVESSSGSANLEPTVATGTSTFDLLVVYTKRAKRRAGGKRAIRAKIELHVARANLALENSRAKARFRLVKTKQVNYQETPVLSSDLNRLFSRTDGQMDGVHGLRERFGADFVSLYRFHPEDTLCGTAFLGWSQRMLDMEIDPVTRAFSVVRSSCAGWVLGHELGHNLGLLHNRESYSNPDAVEAAGARRYSFGYKKPGGSDPFLTLMAIECSGCTRLNQFSNPRRRYENQRTGVSRSKPNAADAARSINQIRRVLAEHLECKVDCD